MRIKIVRIKLLIVIISQAFLVSSQGQTGQLIDYYNDIQPIFNNNCIACHGGQRIPDLRSDYSYNELIINGYVEHVPERADSSILYLILTSPSHSNRSTTYEKAMILQWIREGAFPNPLEKGTFIDIRDSSEYSWVKIGDQVWMAENLRSIAYYDGELLIDGTGIGPIQECNPAKYYFWLNDDSTNNAQAYGALYTWTAAMKGATSSSDNPSGVQGVCPTGWHLPSDPEWRELEIFLGMEPTQENYIGICGKNEGGKLKESGMEHWESPNTGATNSSGFSALPGGRRWNEYAIFIDQGLYASFWSSTDYTFIPMEDDSSYTIIRGLSYDNTEICRYGIKKCDAASVRCVKDSMTTSITIKDYWDVKELRIYPNPINDIITIKTKQPGQHIIEIHTLNGQLFYGTIMKGHTLQIDLSSFQKGLYFITVRSREFVRTEKIIKL